MTQQGRLPQSAQQRIHADTADMSGCCDSREYNDMFGPRFARHLATRYRKRGLDKTAARMVAYLVDRGLDGASVLEIGGGVGDIQLALLAEARVGPPILNSSMPTTPTRPTSRRQPGCATG